VDTGHERLLNAAGKKCFKVEMDQQKRKNNAGSQRGMARCHDPYKYPMAGLLHCAHCGSVMHGVPYGKTLRYVCGTYANSGGAKCEHNWVAQDELLPNILRMIQECALPSIALLRNTLRKMVADTLDMNSQASNLVAVGTALSGRPPHRSVRAALIRAPWRGPDVCAALTAQLQASG